MQKLILFQEYGEYTAIQNAADQAGLTKDAFWNLLNSALRKLSALYSRQGFMETKGLDTFRFAGIAGVLSLNAAIKIEIVPKFLSPDSPAWKDDFLSLALLTSQGHLFDKLLNAIGVHDKTDLYELIGRIWIDKFEANNRRLIRTYVWSSWTDFSLDGEVDEEDTYLPGPEGFRQSGLLLSRANDKNWILYQACQQLRKKISRPNIADRLTKALQLLGSALNDYRVAGSKTVSLSRNEEWADLLALSEMLIASQSLAYANAGTALMPGFVIRTNDLWEKLILMTVKRAFPDLIVSKRSFLLGKRTLSNLTERSLTSTPDLAIEFPTGLLLGDAKYKTVHDTDGIKAGIISRADIYESIAFLEASGASKIFLFYPNRKRVKEAPCHEQPLEQAEIQAGRIIAVSLGLTGISISDGYKKFTANIRELVSRFL